VVSEAWAQVRVTAANKLIAAMVIMNNRFTSNLLHPGSRVTSFLEPPLVGLLDVGHGLRIVPIDLQCPAT